MNIPQPLRLATGSHQAGSGKGCAMNIVSYINGDATITDYPECSDRFLARIVQQTNDSLCQERNGDLLCPKCSIEAINLGTRTIGTNLTALGWTGEQRQKLYAKLALEQARSVEHLAGPEVKACNDTNEAYQNGKATREELLKARSSASDPAAADAAYAAAAAPYAADAAYAAAAAAAVSVSRLQRAHDIIDRFEELSGVRSAPVTEEVVAEAIEKMVTL